MGDKPRYVLQGIAQKQPQLMGKFPARQPPGQLLQKRVRTAAAIAPLRQKAAALRRG